MALAKITPVHIAIDELDETIKRLTRAKAALLATLPKKIKQKRKPGRDFIINPLNGQKGFY